MPAALFPPAAVPLAINDAAAAIIRVEPDGYLLQLRDAKPEIWYPSCWALFGGGVEPGEDPVVALKRELLEELELDIEGAEFFARFDFDIGGLSLPRYYRNCYIVSIDRALEERLVLHEGAAKRVFREEEILALPNVAPYDAFALFLYLRREHLTRSA
jgi:8-oxo-dGTP pyrophosphatase MutT (NUDIX family)